MPTIPGLKPWNIGYLTGKSKKDYGKDMQAFIDHPDWIIQDGESRDEFEQERAHPLLIEAIQLGEEGDPPIIIGHSSIIHALNHLLRGDGHEIAVKPGGVVEIYEDHGEIDMRAVFKPGKDDSSYATKQQASS